MWMSIDIETYEKYEGSEKSANSIIGDSLFDGDVKQQERMKMDFRKGMKRGCYYPVLNSRKYVIGCAVTDTGERISFLDYKKFWRWIVKKIEDNAKEGEKTYIYGHNISYDMLGIIKDDLFELLSSNLNMISDYPFLASWTIKGKNWGFFVDTYSFFRGKSVESIGNMIGFSKLVMPKEIKEPLELEEYCMRDCEVVLKGMQYLREKLKVLGFMPRKFLTAGQVAMSTFMSSIRKENIHWNIMRSGEVYKGPNLEKCRPAYRGARNEAFKIGAVEDVTLIDINSLYPYAMINMPFPKLNEEMFVKDPLIKGLTIKNILSKKYVGCAECEIDVPKIELGYLPVRFGGKLFFPDGERRIMGTWTTFELRRALELGYKIRDIKWVCLYPVNKENVFREYISRLYELRIKSGAEVNVAVKMIMNNLYGKFAQLRRNKDVKAIYRGELSAWKKRGWKLKSAWGNKYIIERYNDSYVPKFTNLMIAIMITAYSRDYLYKFLSKVKKDDLVYCDTDSIVLKNWKVYKKEFEISKKIGDWKIVAENEDCFVKSEKDYRVGERKKVSGVSRRVVAQMDFDNVKEVRKKVAIGVKDALNNPGENFEKLGTFKDFVHTFKMSGKQDIVLPKVIDERKEWINIID